ncbi:unnamed protein product [Lepidochelys olivacea]
MSGMTQSLCEKHSPMVDTVFLPFFQTNHKGLSLTPAEVGPAEQTLSAQPCLAHRRTHTEQNPFLPLPCAAWSGSAPGPSAAELPSRFARGPKRRAAEPCLLPPKPPLAHVTYQLAWQAPPPVRGRDAVSPLLPSPASPSDSLGERQVPAAARGRKGLGSAPRTDGRYNGQRGNGRRLESSA